MRKPGLLLTRSPRLGFGVSSPAGIVTVTSSLSLLLITSIKSFLPPSSKTVTGLVSGTHLAGHGGVLSPGVVVSQGVGVAVGAVPTAVVVLGGVVDGHSVTKSLKFCKSTFLRNLRFLKVTR